ncbi:cytochrome c oxidase accessory protein CcoG [Ancylobacter sp. TS-1]|uniref:cytochrome c oxidase accessory protein CcoG n=1 Tax=Ancylobacter sp. TS-1 TaxID=1850374 RepID=UPI001265AE26|nr:cytochrome c oxidase accessory protein CcoG [Ancylobacter sp. TS-1]QFR33461.1 cytochrome c oxidase accessory protein CcoG [Ancylobacter sp. TS-1]
MPATTFQGLSPARAVVRPDIPHAVRGRFRSIKTVLAGLMLGFFFLAPWLRWERGPALPGQAILFDLPGRRLFVFGLEFWPQDLPIAVGLMIAGALALFFATTLAGRVWCGFACPQTVWSDLFFAADRLIARLVGKGALERRLRTAAWISIALATGVGFTAFFIDAPSLPGLLLSGRAPAIAYATVLVLTGTTWLLAAYARERVCLHMCPWPRFQAALLDRQSFVVTYQDWRGEPRGRKRDMLRPDLANPGRTPGLIALVADATAFSAPVRGDCIDCTRCVTVCPTGVDIRKGLQMGCIGCGLCIDACNEVMARLERPAGLIRFDVESAQAAPGFAPPRLDWLRPKALAFGLAALLAFGLSGYGMATLADVTAHADPQRNPPFVRLSDGSVRNDYALRLAHRRAELARVVIHAEGLDGAQLRLGTLDRPPTGALTVTVGAGRSLDERLLVLLPRDAAPHGRRDFTLVLTDPASGEELARVPSYFWGPES